MRARTAIAAVVAAAALVVAPAAAAVAANPHGSFGKGRAAKAEAKSAARSLENRLNDRRSFVLGGKVTAVTPATVGVPDSGSVTFVVHGGRFKPLRGAELTVKVSDTAKVTRDGVTDLSAVLVGDHVVVRCHRLDLQVVQDAVTLAWSLSGDAVALRVVASATEDSVAPVAPVAPTDGSAPTA